MGFRGNVHGRRSGFDLFIAIVMGILALCLSNADAQISSNAFVDPCLNIFVADSKGNNVCAIGSSVGYLNVGTSYTGGVSVGAGFGFVSVNGATLGVSGLVSIGVNTPGSLVVDTAGQIAAGYVTVGSTAQGNLTVASGAQMTSTNGMTVGFQGTGGVSVNSGGSLTTAGINIGHLSPSIGNVSVDGVGSLITITSSDGVIVGDAATGNGVQPGGALTITNGAIMTTTGITVANQSGSTGSIVTDGSGSSLTNHTYANIGLAGTGSLNVTSGGSFTTDSLDIGGQAAGLGTVTVDGARSSITDAGWLGVGDAGKGTLTLTNGGLQVFGNMILGSQAGSSGKVVMGQNPPASVNSRINGNVIVGNSGTGEFDQAGGRQFVLGNLLLGASIGGKGTYNLEGSVSNLTVDGIIDIGAAPASNGKLTWGMDYRGSTLSVSGDLVVGDAGTGSMTQVGTLDLPALILGNQASGKGTYTLEGGILTAATESIGIKSRRTSLFLQPQVTFEDPFGRSDVSGKNFVGALFVGEYARSQGEYDLTGGILSASVKEIVGQAGTGMFVQATANGFDSKNLAADLILGSGAAGKGTYLLKGGELIAGFETIGGAGKGTLTQTGGTNSISGRVSVAAQAGSQGSYNLAAGAVHAGSMKIGAGGSFKQTGGSATIDGVTVNAGSFNVSASTFQTGDFTNSGTVTIGSAGSTIIADGAYTQNRGTTSLHGGTLEAGGGIIDNKGKISGTGKLVGTVTVNGGTVKVGASPDPLSISGNFTETGGILDFEVDPDGKGGFLESTLVFNKGAQINISDTNIVFDFVNGAATATFMADGFSLDVFFQVSNGDSFGTDFSFPNVFQNDTFVYGTDNGPFYDLALDPNTGDLTPSASTNVPEPPAALLVLPGLGILGGMLFRKRRRRSETPGVRCEA